MRSLILAVCFLMVTPAADLPATNSLATVPSPANEGAHASLSPKAENVQPPTKAWTPPSDAYPKPVPGPHRRPEPGVDKCLPETPGSEGRKVALSQRVSTGKQAALGKLSLPQQLELTRAFATRVLGGTIVDIFDQAVSGRDPTAQRLQRLRRLAAAGRITDICFASVDRAFRNSVVGRNFFAQMAEHGVHVWIDGACVAHERASAKFTTNIKLAQSEYEADVLLERANKRSQYAALGTTYRRNAPFGFIIVEEAVTR